MTNDVYEMVFSITSARRRRSFIRLAYWFGSNACGPSDKAFSGQLWTSTWTPSAPAAIAARAIGGIRSGRPVAWLGSAMIGRWLWPLTLGTELRSIMLRVESSKERNVKG